MGINLTYLSTVKAWLNVASGTDDLLLGRLITQVSSGIINYLQRPSIFRRSYSELQGGVGNQRIMLRNWPVVKISQLTVDGRIIPPASGPLQAGWTLATWDGTDAGNPQEVTLYGYAFCRGLSNISISYEAGYCIQNEPYTIPGTLTIDTADSLGSWAQDDGVYYASGGQLTAIPYGQTPAAGQYTVSTDGTGTYNFATADSGAAILLNYSFIPAPVEEACIEWIGERYRYRDRIGQVSKSLGGQETASYYLKMPDHIRVMLEPYMKWLPL